MLPAAQPYRLFNDSDGSPLNNGSLFFGVQNKNPETDPISIFWDSAGTQPAAQPVKTSGGFPIWNGSPAIVYTATDFSLTVRNKKGGLVYNTPNSNSIEWALAGKDGSSLVGFLQSGTGAVATTVQNKLRERVSVLDFGAKGDGITDDTAAIQAAMTAAVGKTLDFLDSYTYLISSEIQGVSNVSIVGHSTIKFVTRIRSLLYFGSKSNIRIRGLSFDLGQNVLPTYTLADYNNAVYIGSNYNMAVLCYQSTVIEINNCTISNLYTAGMMFYNCSDSIRVTDNNFTSPVQVQGINSLHLQFQTCNAWISVRNNKFRNAYPTSADYGIPGIYTSGLLGTLDVGNNLFLYCGRNGTGGHQLGAYSSYGDVAQGNIHDNLFLECLQQVIRLTTCHHMDVHDNYCTMSTLAGNTDQIVSIEGSVVLGSAPFGCDDIRVHHNTFIDDYSTQRIGVFAASYDWGYPLKDISIHDNFFRGMKYAVKLSGCPLRVRVENNNAVGPNGNIINYDYTTVVPTQIYGLQANAVIDNLQIRGNILEYASTSNSSLIIIILTGFTGGVETIDISGNSITCDAAGVASAIAYRGVASGDVIVKDNRVLRFALAFDLQTGKSLTLEGNKISTYSATLPFATSGFTTEIKRGNSYSPDKCIGIARLVGGTVTVSTQEVLVGDVILLSRGESDGTPPGHLVISSTTPKTSFTITSTSNTETNYVNWEIRH